MKKRVGKGSCLIKCWSALKSIEEGELFSFSTFSKLKCLPRIAGPYRQNMSAAAPAAQAPQARVAGDQQFDSAAGKSRDVRTSNILAAKGDDCRRS